MNTPNWIPLSRSLPPEGVEVHTKIDEGCPRNETTLKRRGNLWFLPDESIYVYYTPTHWARMEDDES